ncbi:hypothetical protein [Streptomyces sp. NPDC001020]
MPLLSHLVATWREHVATFGAADDGRLFFTEQGRVIGYTTYHRVWHETQDFALSPALTSTPLAKRPYDLRHSALSTWLCAGQPRAVEDQGAAGYGGRTWNTVISGSVLSWTVGYWPCPAKIDVRGLP